MGLWDYTIPGAISNAFGSKKKRSSGGAASSEAYPEDYLTSAYRGLRPELLQRIRNTTSGRYGLPQQTVASLNAADSLASSRGQAEARNALIQSQQLSGANRGGGAGRAAHDWARSAYRDRVGRDAGLAQLGLQNQQQGIGNMLNVGQLDLSQYGADVQRQGMYNQNQQALLRLMAATEKPKKKYGGLIGSAAGMGLGALLAPATGGMSLLLPMMLGAGMGGTVGSGFDQ